jgi:hypothetical protein
MTLLRLLSIWTLRWPDYELTHISWPLLRMADNPRHWHCCNRRASFCKDSNDAEKPHGRGGCLQSMTGLRTGSLIIWRACLPSTAFSGRSHRESSENVPNRAEEGCSSCRFGGHSGASRQDWGGSQCGLDQQRSPYGRIAGRQKKRKITWLRRWWSEYIVGTENCCTGTKVYWGDCDWTNI